jgi:hypothetical protein
MKKWNGKDVIFFGEDARYSELNFEEKEEAVAYLKLWKKFLIMKLRGEIQDYELVDEQWIERDAIHSGSIAIYCTLALKLCFKVKLPSELT